MRTPSRSQIRTGPSDAVSADTEPRQLHFGILAPGYVMERVVAQLVLPATLTEALNAVQAHRSGNSHSAFPRLVPVDPQPCSGSGVLVADTTWERGDCVICVDALQFDRRLFAVQAPHYVTRQQLLVLANFFDRLEVDVYVGDDPQPSSEDSVYHVHTGVTVTFLPPEHRQQPSFTLAQTLSSRFFWSRDPTIPPVTVGQAYCLAIADGAILFISDPRRPTAYRRQIAASLGVNPAQLSLFPANPRVTDASLDGLACSAVIAVCYEPPQLGSSLFGIIIDARPVLRGWHSVRVANGSVSRSEILASLRVSEPAGWTLSIDGVPGSPDILQVHAGQVLVAHYVPHGFSISRAFDVEASIGPSGPPAPTPAGRRPEQQTPSSRPGTAPDGTEATGRPGASGNAADEPRTGIAEDGRDQPQAFTEGTFVVVGQDYSPELVHVRLPTGTPVLAALGHINAAREPQARLCLPRLFAASPQSITGVGVLVAAPIWEPTGALVLLDCTRVNGTLFLLQLPNVLHRQTVLDAAGLGSGPELEVYLKDLPWPLPTGARVDVTHGDVIIIVPVVHGLFTTSSFSDLLRDVAGWDQDWAPDQPYGDHAWVIADDASFVFHVVPGRREFVRVDIARRMDFPHTELSLRPARPPITNHACHGVLTRNVLAAARVPGGVRQDLSRHPVCFLDARPLLLGITWRSAPGGLLTMRRVLDPILHRCPPGY